MTGKKEKGLFTSQLTNDRNAAFKNREALKAQIATVLKANIVSATLGENLHPLLDDAADAIANQLIEGKIPVPQKDANPPEGFSRGVLSAIRGKINTPEMPDLSQKLSLDIVKATVMLGAALAEGSISIPRTGGERIPS